MLPFRLNILMIAGILCLSSCSFFEDDFEDPSPFLQYEATSSIVGTTIDSLRVEVRVINQHRTDAIKLVHTVCNVSVRLTSENVSPVEPTYACVALAVSSTIEPGGFKIFSFEMPVEDILKQGATAGSYEVTAFIAFTQLQQQELSAGSVVLSSEDD